MDENKLDRRVRRTRKLLQDTLLRLIAQHGSLDDLSISYITEEAGLRRATFYLHYKDKEALLLSALQATFDALLHESEAFRSQDRLGGKAAPDAFIVTFNHVAAHASLYRIILNGSAGARVSQQIQQYLAEVVLRSLGAQRMGIPAVVIAQFIAGAEVALVTWWLNAGMPYSPQQMAQMAHQLIVDGVRRYA